MCTYPLRHWLLLATHSDTVEICLVTTAHSEGPRGHVPERLAECVETSDAWLLEEAFGFSRTVDIALEIREMERSWAPEKWL